MKPIIEIENGDGLKYQCHCEWPEEAELHFRWRRALGLECFTVDEEGEADMLPSRRCSILVSLPVPEGIPAGDYWKNGALLRQRFSVRGGHPESWEQAELRAWTHYQAMMECRHEFHGASRGLDGDGYCNKCNLYLHGMYMDSGLRASRLLAFKAHDGVTRKYNGAPYIVHPQSVYMRIDGWRDDLHPQQKLIMAKAAWLHDVIEDCPHIPHADIVDAAGLDAYEIVRELTNPSKERPDLNRESRKNMDREHLKSVSWEAKVIKFFDRVENMKDMERCEDKKYLAKYAAETRRLYDEVFCPFLDELRATFPYAEQMKKEFLSWLMAMEKRSMS